ncbi:MAG: hypothetical protein ACRDY0_05080 [Acidimicrobiales bacterium]
MKCPRCRTRQMVVIQLQLGGEAVWMHSCSACDLRWWQGSAGTLALDGVLSRVARR